MRIVVQNPYEIFSDQNKNFNGYNYKFIEKYCDGIFLYARPWKYFQYKNKMKNLGWKKKIYLTCGGVNRGADILVCFHGKPYCKPNSPSARCRVVKIFHLMDFAEKTGDLNLAMTKGKVDYLMGYCRHDKHSSFFREYLKSYIGRVIGVPFGYGERFACRIPFADRVNKCVALGSLNPVDDPCMPKGHMEEYKVFYREHTYSHELRRTIVEHRDEWSEYIECLLPVYPETKNFSYDAVGELNKYTMFINDASIDELPPARTYEGIASGAVMVAEDLPVYRELGFADRENCILFQKGNYREMIEKIKYYMSHREELSQIQEKSLKLAGNYSHEKVADQLYADIEKLFNVS